MTPQIEYPFKGKYRISFAFGEDPAWYVKVFGYPHSGVDFATPIGTPIRACDTGKIVYADGVPDSNGCGINILHDWGLSQYWHLSRLSATLGKKFNKGQVIGFSGDTGFATGPHLHFGTKVKGINPAGMRRWSNPLNYIADTIPPINYNPVEPRYYRVKLGDSLWKIAIKFYRDGYQWRRIYEANKEKIKDPILIYPLQKFLIP